MGAVEGSVLVVGVGASHGLGAAIARRFAAGGYPVAIAGRNAAKLEATAAELRASGAKVAHVVGDASLLADADRFVAAAEALAPLAVAIHNAGSNNPSPFLKLSEEQFEAHWREHALGGFQTAQAALPLLLKRGEGSLIFSGASRQPARQGEFRALRLGQGGVAQSGPEPGARIRPAEHPCRPRGDRRRHRRGSAAVARASTGRRSAGRTAC
ncbi:MAG: SDR family NAD(P)-dependent oxidoreductase [Thermomicrobiales bacterium]